MIPLALSGDRSYDKDNLRHYLMEGNKIIPGVSSINFDEVSKRKIYESINTASFNRKALFKEKYKNLKFKLGKIPLLCDFYNNADFSPELILKHKDFPCYHLFLNEIEEDYTGELTESELVSLKLISKKLIKGIRPHELIILNCLRYNKYFTIEMIEKCLFDIYGLKNQKESIKGAINFLSLDFYRKEKGDGYQANTVQNFIGENISYSNIFFTDDFKISPHFKKCLANPTYLKHFEDAISYAFLKYDNVYRDENPFKLYEKYSREDVLRLLNWKYFMNGQNIGGYKIKYNTCPIFVTYNKAEDISQTINYDDHFISKELFSWMSRDNRKTSSPELEPLINYNGLDIELFIQKNNDEGIEFYYIGKLTPLNYKQLYRNIDGKDKPIVNFKFKIETPVKDELYDYFTEDLNS